MSRAGWLGFVFAVLMAGSGVSALAQDNVMKICGDKWRVAKRKQRYKRADVDAVSG
jgi:hypothetical protein